jgi:ATP-dependent helicase/nuclease subunit A
MNDLHWSDEKQRLFELDENSVVSASAGTGKTTALTELIVRWIEDAPEDRSLHDLVAITFTEKAAGEMKHRIREFVLDRLAQGEQLELWERVRRSLPASYIGTIHSFCSRILREQAFHFDLDPDFSVLQQREASRHFSRIVNNHISESIRTGDPQARELLRNFGFQEGHDTSHDLQGVMETLLSQCRNHGVKPEDARDRTDSLVQQMHEQIEHRVASCIDAIDDILQIPIDDSTKTGEYLQTFRGIADGLKNWLRTLGAETDMVEFTEWRQKAECVLKGTVSNELTEAREPLREHLGYPKSQPNSSSRGDLQKMVALLNAEPLHDALLDHLISINRTYRTFKREQGYLDFDDLLFTVRDGLKNNPGLRNHYKSKFDVILIDEFQDVNRLQYELLFYLSERDEQCADISDDQPFHEQMELEPGTFAVVGDPKQSIYMFRGADVSLFQETLSDVTERGGTSVHFQENFRSVPELIHFFNAFSREVFDDQDHPFYVSYDERDDLFPVRDDLASDPAPRVELLSPPSTSGSSDEMREQEAETLSKRVQQLLGEQPPTQVVGSDGNERDPEAGDIAVLFRSTSHLQQYERAFRERDISYQLFKGQDFFTKPEVRDISNLFSWLAAPERETPLLGYLKSQMVGVTDDTLVALKSRAEKRHDGEITEAFWEMDVSLFPDGEGPKIERAREQLRTFLQLRDRCTPSELIRQIREKTDLDAVLLHSPRGQQAVANLDKLEALLQQGNEEPMRFYEAARYLEQSVKQQTVEEEAPAPGDSNDRVQLMTVHSAKGLEFPIVMIADMGSVKPRVHDAHLFDPDLGVGVRWRNPDTDIPHQTWSYHRIRERRKKKVEAESQRLLYVAMTRARDYLVLSGWYPEGGWGNARKTGTWWKEVEDLYDTGTGNSLPEVFGDLNGSETHSFEAHQRSVSLRLHRFPSEDPSSKQTDELPSVPDVNTSGITHSDNGNLKVPFEFDHERQGRFSATEVVELMKCPRRYAFLSEHAIPEDVGEEEVIPRKSAERFAWKEAGTLAHTLLEQINGPEVPSPEHLDEIAEHHGPGRFLPDDIRSEVIQRVRSGYQTVYDQYLQNATDLRKEQSFAFRLHDSGWSATIEGTMDLLAKQPDRTIILDYKYAHRRPEKIRDDRLQLMLYALPYLHDSDVDVTTLSCVLCYLREDGDRALYEMHPEREELAQFEERVLSAIATALQQEGDPPMDWEGESERTPCDERRCGFIPFCWEANETS